MTAFDHEVWKQRAKDRCEKSSHKKLAREQFTIDMLAIDGIQTVTKWCNLNKIVVIFTKTTNGTFIPSSNTIEISSSCRPEAQLFLLLHECGHWFERHDSARYASKKKEPKRDRRSLIKRVKIIEEEFKAWDEGRALARRLKVYVNSSRWSTKRAWCLAQYFRWVNY